MHQKMKLTTKLKMKKNDAIKKEAEAFCTRAKDHAHCVKKGNYYYIKVPAESGNKDDEIIVGKYLHADFARKKLKAIKEGCKVTICGLRLPYHVRFMLDEFANIGQIPDFTKKLATMRKYEISSTVILQNLAQIKNMYKDDWGSIMGNCDSFVFLGCPENDTLEYVSKMLGKETITVRDHSTSKGGKGSSSLSYKQQGRELATPDELRRMKDNECIFVLRGEQPYRGLKHQYDTHDNYKYTADANESNVYHFKKKKQKQNLSAPSASSMPSLSSANTSTEMINNSNVPNNDISEEMMKRNLMYRNEGIMESNEKIYSTRPTVNDISVAEMLQQSIDEGEIDSEMYNELIQEFPSTLQEELKSNIKNTNTTTSDTTSNNNTESSKSNSIDDFRFLSSLESSDSDK